MNENLLLILNEIVVKSEYGLCIKIQRKGEGCNGILCSSCPLITFDRDVPNRYINQILKMSENLS